MKIAHGILGCLLLGLLLSPVHATDEYAELTGKSCKFCHIDTSGGGELTAAGQEYHRHLTLADESGTEDSKRSEKNAFLHYLRFVAGLLHLFTAVFWFGTILYVHLILKPAYAASGLPRNEVKVGLFSILIMAVTGTTLTLLRVPSWSFFVETRFGILLMAKMFLFSIMTGTALFVVKIIGPKLKSKGQSQPLISGQKFTLEQLRSLDGKENTPAYISYSGRVFDVTNSPSWKEGQHFGRHRAGVDLTDALKQAPHGEEKVLELPQVGEIHREEQKSASPVPVQAFIILANLNLILVFLIILVLALWRWW